MKIYTLDNDYLFKKIFSQERYLKHLLFNFFDIKAYKKEILIEIKKYNLNSEEYKKMEDIERLMMNETEHYETAYFDGIEIGRSEGISLGKNEGKAEEKLDIAKNMLIENIDINLVSKITGLDKNQIELLK